MLQNRSHLFCYITKQVEINYRNCNPIRHLLQPQWYELEISHKGKKKEVGTGRNTKTEQPMGHWKKLKNNLDTSENRNISQYTGFNESDFKKEIWRNKGLSQETRKK